MRGRRWGRLSRLVAGWPRERWSAKLEHVLGELGREERGLPLLVLGGRGQDVVGLARRLGHRQVEDDHELERREGLAKARAVRQGVRRVRALDDHGAELVAGVATATLDIWRIGT